MKKMLLSGVGYSAEKAPVLRCTVHCIRICCGVGYYRRKTPVLRDTTEKNTSELHPTTEEKLLRCGIQWKKIDEPS
jgi:hypothetical protein